MKSTNTLLLASTALLTVATALPLAQAASADRPLTVAQAAPPSAGEAPAREKPTTQQPKQDQAPKPAQQPRPAQPQAQKPVPAAPAPAAQSKPPAATQPKPPQQPTAQTPATPKPPQQPAAQAPAGKPPAPAAQAPKPPVPAAQTPATKPPAPAAQTPAAKPPAAAEKPTQPGAKPPASAEKPTPPGAKPPAPAAQERPPQPPAQPAAQPAGPRQPPQPHDASDFIRRDNQKPARGLEDVRRERHETREGDRVTIQEGSRTIIRENNRVIIRHSEVDRFTVGARGVRVERRGGNTETIIERPNGVRIVNITGPDGRLIRRVRRDRDGREIVIINNVYPGPRTNVFIDVDMGPPVIRIPRDRYILTAERATPALIYEVFMEPPVERLERRYTLEQVRYSAPLRDRMPRVDLDINFETGSWQLTPEQVGKLSAMAEGLNRAIKASPREVFLIEGHTDAVGSAEDNLSLSDRRAEAVAVALAEQFQVPAENLVTQGYGEEGLKVQTQEAERANRRVSVRRITPLIEQAKK